LVKPQEKHDGSPPVMWMLVYKLHELVVYIMLSTINHCFFATFLRQLNAIDWGPHPVGFRGIGMIYWVDHRTPRPEIAESMSCLSSLLSRTEEWKKGDVFCFAKSPKVPNKEANSMAKWMRRRSES
jgi:hypothetical protein